LRVWQIADDMTARQKRPPRRGEVIEAAVREGISYGTASTQYNHWRREQDKLGDSEQTGLSEAAVSAPLNLALQVGSDGRVLIPAEFRRQMKIDDSGRLTARVVDGELRLISPTVALDHLHRLFAPLRGGPSLADELIAERRAEADRE